MEYDDGVYFGSAAWLLHGLVPYRDFALLQPPGIALALVPFAAIARLFDQPTGMALARTAILVVEVGNLIFIRRLCALSTENRHAPLLGTVGAFLYAIFPGAVTAGHTVLLEPPMNAVCLGASYLLLDPRQERLSRRRAMKLGGLLAIGVCFKAFAAVYACAALMWLVCRRRPREAAVVVTGCGIGLAVILGPFITLAPTSFWRDVVTTQLARPQVGPRGVFARLLKMVGLTVVPSPLAVLLIVAMLGLAINASVRGEFFSMSTYWLAILIATATAFSLSPSYFSHYAGFLGPPLAITVTLLLRSSFRRADTRVALAVLTILVVAIAETTANSLASTRLSATNWRQASALIPPGACVYYSSASLAVAVNGLRPPGSRCPVWLDGRGEVLILTRHWPPGEDFYPAAGFRRNTAWQQATGQQIRTAELLLTSGDPRTERAWSPSIRDYVRKYFVMIWRAGGSSGPQLWRRRSQPPRPLWPLSTRVRRQ